MGKMHLCTVALMLSGVLVLHAEMLSADQALLRALHSVTQSVKVAERDNHPSHFTKAMGIRAASQSDVESVYLFTSDDGGYIVVSASDRSPALLGYGNVGVLPVSNMPPAMKWWLEGYARQIECLESNNLTAIPKAKSADRKDIPPMIKTKWGQYAPYNDKMPKIEGGAALTGCVATSMAQVMNYHKFPEKGVGTHSYEWPENSGKIYSFDYDNSPFDWSNMLETYAAGSYSDRQAEAVATLMRACAISVDMHYNVGESGSSNYSAHKALKEIFGYSESVECVDQCWHVDDWEDIMYKEVSEGRPIIYGGIRMNGVNISGHSFILDGYEDKPDGNYFHFNWGWEGSSDGYFLLNIDGDGENYDPSKNPYNIAQEAVIGIEPGRGGIEIAICEFVGDAAHADVSSLCIRGLLTNSGTESWSGRIGFDVYDLRSDDDKPKGCYVYFNNEKGWAQPCVWAWNDTEKSVCANPIWPGDRMVEADGVWTWKAPDGKIPTKIIFSDNGQSQTADLEYVNGATYWPDGHNSDAKVSDNEDNDQVLYTAYTPELSIEGGASGDFVTLPWETSSLETGHSYKAIPRLIASSGLEETLPAHSITFTIDNRALGLRDINGSDEGIYERWYDLGGRPVSPSDVQSGIYVRRILRPDSSASVSKIYVY